MKQKSCRKCGQPRTGKVCTWCGYQEKRGGGRQGTGPKKKPAAPSLGHGNSQQTKNAASEMLEALNRPAPDPQKGEEPESYEIQKFREIDNAGIRESLDLRKWLYDKRDGKAPQKVELGGNLNLTARRERIRKLASQFSGLAGKS